MFDVFSYCCKGLSSVITVQYNATALHSLPAAINLLTNTLLNMLLPANSAAGNISMAANPWPEDDFVDLSATGSTLGSTMLLGMAIIYIPAGMALFVVKEREVSQSVLHLDLWCSCKSLE